MSTPAISSSSCEKSGNTCSLSLAYVPRSAEWSRSRCPPSIKLRLRPPSRCWLGTSGAPPYRMACRECTLRWDDESGIALAGISRPLQSEGFRFLGRRDSHSDRVSVVDKIFKRPLLDSNPWAGRSAFLHILNVDRRLFLADVAGSVVRVQLTPMFQPLLPLRTPIVSSTALVNSQVPRPPRRPAIQTSNVFAYESSRFSTCICCRPISLRGAAEPCTILEKRGKYTSLTVSSSPVASTIRPESDGSSGTSGGSGQIIGCPKGIS